jgi:putative ABC transport system permease protein
MIVGDYFKAAGIPLRRGVAFTPAGRSGAAYETVIDETLARDAFPGSDPIGRRLIWKGIPPLTVVGVVGAIRDERLDSEPVATMYLPQWVFPQPSLALAVRGDGDPLAAAPAVRRIVHDLDPDLPVYGVMTMSSLVSHSLASSRTRALLLGLIAALALVLATVGVYGVTAHAVSRRTAEIGLRMALGAKPSQVLRLVLRQAMRPVVLGAAAGVVLSLSVGRAIASQLYHVRPTDPVTLATVPLVLVLVAGIATLIPARRAARVEPMAALREP